MTAQVCNRPDADFSRVACLPIMQGLIAAAAYECAFALTQLNYAVII
jgi:hypothetical protein